MFDRKAEGRYWDFGWQLVEGCTRVADGCQHCWSLDKERRFRKETGVVCHEERLDRPLKRRKPASYAVWNDLFHKDVTDDFRDEVFGIMHRAPQHKYLILTKRIQRMLDYISAIQDGWLDFGEGRHDPPPFIWAGVSCSNQADADKNIPILLQIPAAVRFVSFEPLLEGIDIQKYPDIDNYQATAFSHSGTPDWYKPLYRGLDWAIIGAETIGIHPGRPCKFEHVRNLIGQCKIAGVPVFVKQIDTRELKPSGVLGYKVSKNPEEWPEDLRLREYPDA